VRLKKQVSLILSFIIFSVFLVNSAFSQFAPEAVCDETFCMQDAYDTGGNQTIRVCGGSSTPATWFNIWYGTTGPLNLTSNTSSAHNGILSATYTNSTPYNEATGLSNTTPCVNFVLNLDNGPFTNQTTLINATMSNNTIYLNAVEGNFSMFTINYVAIETQDISGAALPNVALLTINNVTKAFIQEEPGLTDSTGYWAEHCIGFVQNGNCVNATTTVTSNTCVFHGVPFDVPMGGDDTLCVINDTVSIVTFDFIASNTSTTVNVTPETVSQIVVDTSTAIGFVMPFSFQINPGPPTFLNVTSINLTDYFTSELVYSAIPSPQVEGEEGPGGGAPFFITSNKLYNLNMIVQGIGEFSYPIMTPSIGMTGVDIMIPNASVTEYTTFIGKVVDESAVAIGNATVYGQFSKVVVEDLEFNL